MKLFCRKKYVHIYLKKYISSTPLNTQQQNQFSDSDENVQEEPEQNKDSQWPHGFSRTLALLCCTLGLFNISRFSVFSIHFGANFLVQFLILSIIFGIPLLWLQMCLGAKIRSGPIAMWKISPICKGIGISLVLSQCMIALYSAISLGWILIYFRDSFVSRNERYRWQEPFEWYRGSSNSSYKLAEAVADYFNGIVLQRLQLGPAGRAASGGVRFQLAFNLAILWSAVFIVLCRGLQSFGKIALGLTLLPLIIFIANIFPATHWPDFFLNSKCWLSAAQKTFLTWGLLGASVISISSKSAEKSEGKTILRRDAILVVILTLFGLFMSAIFGNACIQILHNNGYLYFPDSYEHIDTYTFLYSTQTAVPTNFVSTPPKWLQRYSTVMGEKFRRPGMNPLKESGYQALRLVTEIFPATLAAATQEYISPVWSLMGFLMLLIFGLAQLCAMWKPVSNILGSSTSSVLLSCIVGLLLGIPLATEMGISIIHYLDMILGEAWWILILWAAQIFALFLIRGRPYNGDVLVNDLKMTQSLSAFLTLSWNRIQLLYRPTQSPQPHHRNSTNRTERLNTSHQSTGNGTSDNTEAPNPQDDAPPKYKPPPSYTTATGARIAKMLRQSIRRSVRRILGESSRHRPSLQNEGNHHPNSNLIEDGSLPPAYSTVLINPFVDNNNRLELNDQRENCNGQTIQSLDRNLIRSSNLNQCGQTSTNPRQRSTQTFTAFDVAQLLRPNRYERSSSTISACVDNVLKSSSLKANHSRSAENLVLNAAPLGESSAIIINSDAVNTDENTSVI